MTASATSPYLSTRQAAAYLHLNVETMQALARAGKVRGSLLGKGWLFRPEDLDAYVEAHRNQTGRRAS